jgi:hypothetical protein
MCTILNLSQTNCGSAKKMSWRHDANEAAAILQN